MSQTILSLFVFLIIFSIYSPWLIVGKTLSGGDWPYLFLENIREFSFLPPSGSLWLAPYYQITAKLFVEYLGFNWNLAEKILWFWPFLFLSIFSSYYLTKSWLGVLIYTTNTYVLMLVGGGQMGVAFAYSMAPLVLRRFINLVDFYSFSSNNEFKIQNLKFKITVQNLKLLKKPIIAGLLLAIQIMFDPRVAYISMIAVVLYFVFSIKYKVSKENLVNIFYVLFFAFLIPVGIAILINSYWMTPFIQVGPPPALKGYTSLAGFEFFSFADFSHSLSLLHPNWPENIFGKVYFMRAEFMLLPIIAFGSLLFLKNPKSEIRNPKGRQTSKQIQNSKFKIQNNLTIEQFNNQKIIFFALLGLIGAFLAKGSNPPFGEINVWLFQYFPGMSMFRDATKFYILIVLSYSILIPFSLGKISENVSGIRYQVLGIRLKPHNTYYIILTTFLVFWLFSIRPAIGGQLGGTFKPQVLPQEYIQLKDFLVNQPQFFKTLWMPKVQRFGFSSKNHPAIGGLDYFNASSLSKIIEKLKKPETQKLLKNSSIKYIIIPYDSREELFIVDRKYSEKQHSQTIAELKKIPGLRQLPSIGRIIIFEV